MAKLKGTYWTKSREDKPVFHDDAGCSEGGKIRVKDLRVGKPPSGRVRCEVCAP